MNQATLNAQDSPVVSVITATYQHEQFIEGTVQGILAQRTDFPFELLIGEDDSSDGTREICEQLAKAHPDRIRLFLRDRKNVIHIMGRPTARANIMGLYESARGKYLAICPGDDQWIDPDKLQAQVDLLEAHPEYSSCATNAWNEREGLRTDYLRSWTGTDSLPVHVEADRLVESNFIPAATFVFRRELLYPLPVGFSEAPISDHLLVLHMAVKGPMGILDRISAVRHVHPMGLISAKDALHKADVNLAMIPFLDVATEGRFSSAFARNKVNLLRKALQYCIDTGDRKRAQQYLKELVRSDGQMTVRERARWYTLVHASRLASWYYWFNR